MFEYKIRHVVESDWVGIMVIQNHAYAMIGMETEEVLRSKVACSSRTCFVCVDNQDRVLGYCLSHAYYLDQYPSLNEVLVNTVTSDNLFIHDLAVNKNAQGQGIANLLFKALKKQATALNFTSISLVAIQGAASFWSKYHFEKLNKIVVSKTYGIDAHFMTKKVVTLKVK